MAMRLKHANLVGGCAHWRRKGATLLELLVVMSLISLLVVSLVPSLSRSMRTAKDTVCKNHLREVGRALFMYELENDGALPSLDQTGEGIQALRERKPWFSKLFPTYLQDPMILTCPEDPLAYRMAKAGSDMENPRVADYASYGINGFMMTAAGGSLADVARRGPRQPLETIMLADLGPDSVRAASSVRGVAGAYRNASLLSWDDGFDPFAGEGSRSWLTDRHISGMNVRTLSGDVRAARTDRVRRTPIRRYYGNCAAGGCTFCNDLRAFHYSFAKDRLFWWTGKVSSEF